MLIYLTLFERKDSIHMLLHWINIKIWLPVSQKQILKRTTAISHIFRYLQVGNDAKYPGTKIATLLIRRFMHNYSTCMWTPPITLY